MQQGTHASAVPASFELLRTRGFLVGPMIGEGGYATVHHAFRSRDGRECAVKVIDKRTCDKAYLHKYTVAEIRALKRLNHEHVIEMVDALESSEHVYIIMELATQGDLIEKIIRDGAFPAPLARHIFKQVLLGVEFCHANAIVHRDLKLDNILLDAHGNVKVSDFGFARCDMVSELRTLCGSLAYAAPEVLRRGPYDGKAADVWSCGVILFVLVVAKLPFDDSSLETLLLEVHRIPQMPATVLPDCRQLVFSLLNPEARLRPTVTEALAHPFLARGSQTTLALDKLWQIMQRGGADSVG